MSDLCTGQWRRTEYANLTALPVTGVERVKRPGDGVQTNPCIQARSQTFLCVCVCTHVCICVYIHAHMGVYVYIYMCILIYKFHKYK